MRLLQLVSQLNVLKMEPEAITGLCAVSGMQAFSSYGDIHLTGIKGGPISHFML